MNKIYLFLFALLAASFGYMAKADFTINGDDYTFKNIKLSFEEATGTNWGSIEFQKNRDDEIKITGFQPKKNNTKISISGKFTQGSTNGDVWYEYASASTLGEGDSYLKRCVKTDGGADWEGSASGYEGEIKTNFSTDKIYDIYLSPFTNSGYTGFKIYISAKSAGGGNTGGDTSGNYYFYGDMNRWSSLDNAGTTVGVWYATQGGEELERENHVSEFYEKPYPTYYSKTVLDRDWKLKPVDKNNEYGDAKEGSGWYYISFKNLYDPDGNKGRLCGQFVINTGYHRTKAAEAFCISGGSKSYDYFVNKAMKADGTQLSVNQGEGQQNICLEANYVQDAVLYFNPTAKKIMLTGTPVYNYVYYAIADGTATEDNIKSYKLTDDGQYNYFINADGFNGTSLTNAGGNPLESNNFKWEVINSSNQTAKLKAGHGAEYLVDGKIIYDGREYTQILRRRIPASGHHRYPRPVTVRLTDTDMAYDPVTLTCDDVWFVNTEKVNVNVYFRYDDEDMTNSLNWVGYNVFKKDIDATTSKVNGYDYLFGGYRTDKTDDPSIHGGDYALMEKTTLNGVTWWKSVTDLPAEYTSSAYAIFGDSRGSVYPAERVRASESDLHYVAINGNDLFYVATTKSNPSLLYSTLNGSYSIEKSENGIVQINAEMFDPSTMKNANPTLISDLGLVTYRFEIWYNGHLVAETAPNITDEDGYKFDENGYSAKPFFNWEMDSQPINPSEAGFSYFKNNPGYYFIVVKALFNGTIYAAQDTYAIYK